jgi:carbonic anhydrase
MNVDLLRRVLSVRLATELGHIFWEKTMHLKCSAKALLVVLIFWALTSSGAFAQEKSAVTAEQALERLKKGNEKFVTDRSEAANVGAERRRKLAQGQHPFAIILTCADSRVAPEIVFDQGLGDLFVVRVAGNIADAPAIGSLEYAATVLEVPVIVVLGHSSCGAVEAALKTPSGTQLSAGLGSLVEAIRPAVAQVKDKPGDPLNNAVRANVVHVVGQLTGGKPLGDLVTQGKVKVAGAHYDLASGVVELLG